MRILGKPSSTRCGQGAIDHERTRLQGTNPVAAWRRNRARSPDRESDVVSGVAAPPITATVEVHRAGLAAIAHVTERYADDDWMRPTPCDEWTALDLAGHTITAAMTWHEALDDAAAGAPTSRWRWAELPRANAEYLDSIPAASGPDRVEEFVTLATGWGNRVADTDPELPIPVAVQDICPSPLTVAMFTWLAGAEFHLRAWDFAQAIGDDYRARTDHAHSIRTARVAPWGSASDEGDPWDLIIRESRS